MAGNRIPLAPRLAPAVAVVLALVLPVPAPAASAAHTETPGIAGPYLAAEAAARRGDVAAAARWYRDALDADPENATLLSRAILNLVAAGDVGAAVPLAERLDEDRPGHLGVIVLAAEALGSGTPGRALELLEAKEGEQGAFVGRLVSAWAAFAAGEREAARETLAALEEGGSVGAAGDIVSAYHLALVETATGRDEEALAAVDRAIASADGATGRLARVRAGILARLGRIEEARAAVAGQLDQTLGGPRLERLADDLAGGTAPPPLVTNGREGAAEALFGVAGLVSRGANRQIGLAYARLAVHLDAELVEARLLIGEMLAEAGQHDLAIAAFEAVPREAPEALQAALGRAQAMEAAGRTDEAIAVLGETAATHPGSLEAQLALGDMLRRAERWTEAGEAYSDALALIDEPAQRHWSLYYQRGIAYERSDQWEKAERDFLKALELQPEQPLVLNYLGYSWVEQREHLDRAKAMIEKAVEQRPEDGYIVDSLGWVLFRLGEFEKAADHLEEAVELRPTDAVINDHYGDALWMIGRKTEARFQWKRALSFEPEEEAAERIRKKLRQGLDAVLAEEKAAGEPAVIKSTADSTKPNDGG